MKSTAIKTNKTSGASIPVFADHQVKVLERSKGFYWRRNVESRLHGPFESLLEALEDIDLRANGRVLAIDEDEMEEQYADVLGVSNWIDPDTGMLAEENTPRLGLH